jgi:hypothetical protein
MRGSGVHKGDHFLFINGKVYTFEEDWVSLDTPLVLQTMLYQIAT